MQSVMVHQFSQVPRAEIPRSSFNRSHGYKTTFDAGLLIPFYADEALPGDTFNLRANIFARLATPIAPIMDNMYMDTHYFAVPVRLIWDNWLKFNGEQVNPGDSTDFLVPQVVAPAVTGFQPQTLSDYLGLPTGVPGISVASFWHRAYNLIYNTWYRDQNLQNSLTVDKGDGPDNLTNYTLRRRGKRHDYFTACLPWPQKGPGVELPVGGQATVFGNGKALGLTDGTTNVGLLTNTQNHASQWVQTVTKGANAYNSNIGFTATSTFSGSGSEGTTGKSLGVVASGESGLFADLSTASAVTINSLRQAFQIQKLLERDARGGSRYIEIVQSHFGVTSPDLRATRPIFLGSSTARVIINPVQQTSSTDATSPQGNLAGFGVVADAGQGFVHSFTEHCVVLGLVSVRADLTYQQGIPRMFSRSTRYDFYWPALAHLGEQAVLNKEIYAQGTSADEDVFGYQERWAEYRYFPSQITGKLRSTDPQSLDVWHLSQEFTELPALNTTFIQEDPPVDRVIAVPSEPHFIFDSFIDLKCARPMPVYSVPGLIDHF